MGIIDWINATDEDDEEDIVEEESKQVKKEKPVKAQAKNVARTASTRDSDINVFSPKSYQEASKIGAVLKASKAAIVNVSDLPKEQSKRITDFLQGIVFAIDGNFYVIGDKVILYVPANISVEEHDGTRELEEE